MNDLEIRTELLHNFLANEHSEQDTRVIEELGVCQGTVKMDVTVVNSPGSLVLAST